MVALGVKHVETRSWSTNYRGPLAIHSGAKQVHSGHFLFLARTARSAGLLSVDDERLFRFLDVPFGAVIATCRLVDCVRTERIEWHGGRLDVEGQAVKWARWGRSDATDARVAEDQRPYGDFATGRYAWLLTDIAPLPEPVSVKGKQGLWEWTA